MRSLLSVSTLLALVLSASASAQSTLEVAVGAGYTKVDPGEWIANNITRANHLATGITAQYLLGAKEPRAVQLGFGVGYMRVLDYDQDFGGGDVRSKTANAIHVNAMIRFWFHGERLYIETGPGAYRFGDFTNPFLAVGGGIAFDVTERVSIPIKARADLVFDRFTQVTPFHGSVGVAYQLGG